MRTAYSPGFLLALTFLAPLFAGVAGCSDIAVFELIGFSQSGEYLAWEQYGIQDGSGFPYSLIEIVHVPSGSTVVVEHELYVFDEAEFFDTAIPDDWRPLLDEQEREFRFWEEYARPIARSRIREEMSSLGVIEGNVGTLCVHHPLTDRSLANENVRFVTGMLAPSFDASPEFEILLELPIVASMEETAWECGFVTDARALRLELICEQLSYRRVLVDDTQDAVDRSAWVYGYQVRDVVVYRDTFVAVVLRKSVPGFEGPDVRFRVVTGRLPDLEPGFWYYSSG